MLRDRAGTELQGSRSCGPSRDTRRKFGCITVWVCSSGGEEATCDIRRWHTEAETAFATCIRSHICKAEISLAFTEPTEVARLVREKLNAEHGVECAVEGARNCGCAPIRNHRSKHWKVLQVVGTSISVTGIVVIRCDSECTTDQIEAKIIWTAMDRVSQNRVVNRICSNADTQKVPSDQVAGARRRAADRIVR